MIEPHMKVQRGLMLFGSTSNLETPERSLRTAVAGPSPAMMRRDDRARALPFMTLRLCLMTTE